MVTISDVARVAGVSISTVSYALSGKRSIAGHTKERIEAAIRELGYRPNAGARMLAGGQTRILAVTEPLRADTYTPAHMAFVLALAKAARRYDYDILLLTQEEASEGLRRVTTSRLVDGVIVLDVTADDERADVVRSMATPAVFLGIPADTAGLVCVDLDFEGVARLAVDRLADAGHQTIGLLGHPQQAYERGSNYASRLRDAFHRHAQERGLQARFAIASRDEDLTRDAVDTLLGPERDLTGLVMHCEAEIQRTALEAISRRQLQVPRDVSVVSAASTFATTGFTPALDVIPLVPEHTCDRAVDLAVRQLDDGVEPRVELVPPTYVDHGSVTPRIGADR